MTINFMTWNTGLYGPIIKSDFECGIDSNIFNGVKDKVIEHLKKPNSIAVLQEIPFKWKNDKGEYVLFKEAFPVDEYTVIYYNLIENSKNDKLIMITVAIANSGFISDDSSLIKKKHNRFVPFTVVETGLKILGVHSSIYSKENRNELKWLGNWLKENPNYKPNIILGDFNSGNYIKNGKNKDAEFAPSRQNYLLLTEGYIDIFQGCYTTNYSEPTQIDHALLENSHEFALTYKYSNAVVHTDIKLSDHYPLTFELEIDEQSKKNGGI